MDILFELLFELALAGGVEASICKKVPKPIRYLLILIIVLFYLFIIGIILYTGISILKDSILGGIIIILLDIFIFVKNIISFKSFYIEKTKKNK